MKSLLFSLLLGSLSAHAQSQNENVLGYAEDINIKGKVFERYQTPKGDNVLISKEDAKKRGVFLFEGAKRLLLNQGTFEVGFGIFAHNTVTVVPESAFETIKPSEAYRLQRINVEGDALVGWRPAFYRHVRIQGELSFVPWQEVFASDTDKEINKTLSISSFIYTASFDHDIIVIPAKETFHALSLGYFATRTNLLLHQRKKNGAGFDKEASLPWNDNGPVVNYRWAGLGDNGPFMINVQAQFGIKGTKRISAGVIIGFGGRN